MDTWHVACIFSWFGIHFPFLLAPDSLSVVIIIKQTSATSGVSLRKYNNNMLLGMYAIPEFIWCVVHRLLLTNWQLYGKNPLNVIECSWIIISMTKGSAYMYVDVMDV